MSKKGLIILLSLGFFWTAVFGNPTYEKLKIGTMEESSKIIFFKGVIYPLYQFLDSTYIPLEYVENMGVSCDVTPKGIWVNHLENKTPQLPEKIVFKTYEVTMNPESVYVKNLRTYSICSEEHIFIPVETLEKLWDVTLEEGIYKIIDKGYNVEEYIQMNDTKMINTSSHLLKVNLIDIVWDGEYCKEHLRGPLVLEPYQSIEKLSFMKDYPPSAFYITTLVSEVNDFKVPIDYKNHYGQKNSSLFKAYDYALKVKELTALFKPYIVKGKLKYNIGQFSMGDVVPIWRAEKRQYYVVKNKNIILPWDSLSIEGEGDYYLKQAAPEQIQDYANIKNMTSETPYLLWTDLYRQRTYVLKKEGSRWHLEKSFICSSGKSTHPTPGGIFKIEYSSPYIGMGKGYRCKNAMVFFRDYMYHSILFDSEGKYIIDGLYQLGRRVSHGCIRLSEEDSAWIYTYVPIGTTVWIQ